MKKAKSKTYPSGKRHGAGSTDTSVKPVNPDEMVMFKPKHVVGLFTFVLLACILIFAFQSCSG